MDQIVKVLVTRLSHKGIFPDEVPWLIRDVLNVFNKAAESTVDGVNRRLVSLGWDEEILDEFTFELIIYLAVERNEENSLG